MQTSVTLSASCWLNGALLALGMAASVPAQAAEIQSYLKIDGIAGESIRTGHVGDIELSGYSQTFGTRNCSRVVLNKLVDSASPALIGRAAGNVFTPRAVISMRKVGDGIRVDFFTAILDSVSIEKIELNDSTGTLLEQVTLRPRSIRIEYRPQAADGTFAPAIVSTVDCN
jgi:type VI protein secretion system component Hcp